MQGISGRTEQACGAGQVLARWRHLRGLLAFGLARRPWLLIYQMGKVGSQTIEATLRAARLPHRIRRVHILSPRQGQMVEDWLRSPSLSELTKASLRRQWAEARAIYAGIALRRRWALARRSRRRLQVVVGVREPVGLLLASVFQNYSSYFASLGEITTEACRSLVSMAPPQHEARRRQIQGTLGYIHGWFDAELREVLGIDVYSRPFAHSKGCAVYENSVARVLVYRYEDFARITGMLESFLNTKLGALVNRNIGADKEYGARYRDIQARLRLPASFLAGQYDSRMARHFYSPAERAQLQARWRG